MKNKSTFLIVLIFSLLLIPFNIAQSIKSSKLYYTTSWEKVDSLEQIGLTRSALEMVEKIYKTAKKDNVHPQFIKSVLFLSLIHISEPTRPY